MTKNITANRSGKEFDQLVELFLFPETAAQDAIGQIIRKGKVVFYAFFDGGYYEAPTRLQVAQKLATKHIGL